MLLQLINILAKNVYLLQYSYASQWFTIFDSLVGKSKKKTPSSAPAGQNLLPEVRLRLGQSERDFRSKTHHRETNTAHCSGRI